MELRNDLDEFARGADLLSSEFSLSDFMREQFGDELAALKDASKNDDNLSTHLVASYRQRASELAGKRHNRGGESARTLIGIGPSQLDPEVEREPQADDSLDGAPTRRVVRPHIESPPERERTSAVANERRQSPLLLLIIALVLTGLLGVAVGYALA
jgi:hypothetical protein